MPMAYSSTVTRPRFADKTAIVIGGNSGIGLAIASQLVLEGAHTVITGRDAATLESARLHSGAVHAIRCDILDIQSLDSLYTEVSRHCSGLDVLFVNAGVGAFAPMADVTEALWDHVVGINLKGCFFVTQKLLALLRPGGAIVFTGSIGAVLPLKGNSIYAAAKGGLRALARVLAVELLERNIRVNVVSPGPTETPIFNRNVAFDPARIDELRATMSGRVPMGRMGQPEEVARAALFLGSTEASFITGVDLFVDGGCVEL